MIRVLDLGLSEADIAELTHYSSWLVAAVVGGYTVTDGIELLRTKIEVSGVMEDVAGLVKKIVAIVKETIAELPVSEKELETNILKRLEELAD